MLQLGGKDVTLQVKWDKIPQYCSACKHVGHSEDHCYALGKRPVPPKKDFSRSAQQEQNEMRGEQRDQPRGEQPNAQAETKSGWNRVGKNGNIVRDSVAMGQNKGGQAARYEYRVVANRNDNPSTSIQVRKPFFAPNSGMLDQPTLGKGKEKKKRSPESRERYREKRRLRRLEETEGRVMSETEGSEFETDDGGESGNKPRSLSPIVRGNRVPILEEYLGLGFHSNKFDILEDDDLETETSMALVLHDGTADAQIIHEARRAKGVRNGAPEMGACRWRSPVMGIDDLRSKHRRRRRGFLPCAQTDLFSHDEPVPSVERAGCGECPHQEASEISDSGTQDFVCSSD